MMTEEQLNKLPKYVKDEILALRRERDRVVAAMNEGSVKGAKVLQLHYDPRHAPIGRPDCTYRFWVPSTKKWPGIGEYIDVKCTDDGIRLLGSSAIVILPESSNLVVARIKDE